VEKKRKRVATATTTTSNTAATAHLDTSSTITADQLSPLQVIQGPLMNAYLERLDRYLDLVLLPYQNQQESTLFSRSASLSSYKVNTDSDQHPQPQRIPHVYYRHKYDLGGPLLTRSTVVLADENEFNQFTYH
jgi:hypothetical protein